MNEDDVRSLNKAEEQIRRVFGDSAVIVPMTTMRGGETLRRSILLIPEGWDKTAELDPEIARKTLADWPDESGVGNEGGRVVCKALAVAKALLSWVPHEAREDGQTAA